MKKSLKEFHFDPEKSGQILKGWAKGAGKSYQKVAEETNYSYDTINNSLHGKIKELSLERVFKVSVCTGHSVCEYIRLMLQDEDIDFADQIHVLAGNDYTLVPYKETAPEPVHGHVQGRVHDTHIPQDVYALVMEKAREVNQANLERFTTLHKDHIQALEKDYEAHIATVRKVARQRLKWIIILAIILVVVFGWFVWELTHPEAGVLRLR